MSTFFCRVFFYFKRIFCLFVSFLSPMQSHNGQHLRQNVKRQNLSFTHLDLFTLFFLMFLHIFRFLFTLLCATLYCWPTFGDSSHAEIRQQFYVSINMETLYSPLAIFWFTISFYFVVFTLQITIKYHGDLQ